MAGIRFQLVAPIIIIIISIPEDFNSLLQGCISANDIEGIVTEEVSELEVQWGLSSNLPTLTPCTLKN